MVVSAAVEFSCVCTGRPERPADVLYTCILYRRSCYLTRADGCWPTVCGSTTPQTLGIGLVTNGTERFGGRGKSRLQRRGGLPSGRKRGRTRTNRLLRCPEVRFRTNPSGARGLLSFVDALAGCCWRKPLARFELHFVAAAGVPHFPYKSPTNCAQVRTN